MDRLIAFNRVICPSTGLVLHGVAMAATTASVSRSRPLVKLFSRLPRAVSIHAARAAPASATSGRRSRSSEGACQLTGADQIGCCPGKMAEKGPLSCLEPIRRHPQQAGAAPGGGRRPSRSTAHCVRSTSTFLTALPRGPANDAPLAAPIALSPEFAPEPRAVVAALGPAAGEEGLVRGDIAGPLRLVVRWRSAGLEPAMDRKRAGADGTADRVTRQAQPMQPDHLLVAATAAVVPLRAQPLLARDRRHGPPGAVVCLATVRAA